MWCPRKTEKASKILCACILGERFRLALTLPEYLSMIRWSGCRRVAEKVGSKSRRRHSRQYYQP